MKYNQCCIWTILWNCLVINSGLLEKIPDMKHAHSVFLEKKLMVQGIWIAMELESSIKYPTTLVSTFFSFLHRNHVKLVGVLMKKRQRWSEIGLCMVFVFGLLIRNNWQNFKYGESTIWDSGIKFCMPFCSTSVAFLYRN